MLVRDAMTRMVATVPPDMPIEEVARFLLDRHISAAPVVDQHGRMVGIISEGDLIRRPEIGAERQRSWWLALLSSPAEVAGEFVKTHGHRASDVMTQKVISVGEDAPLGEVAGLLEKYRVKRLPVVREGKLVGIISRADILRVLAASRAPEPSPTLADDREIRKNILDLIASEGLPGGPYVNIMVTDGVVHLWGLVDSEEVRKAFRVAAESVPGVRGIEDHLGLRPRYLGGV
jgi:CBS domain-containing protein